MANDRRALDRLESRLRAMEQERQSFVPHWKLLSEFTNPRRGRFETTDRNKGDRRHQSIINARATQSLQIATSGMFNGTMSQSRPWFRLEDADDPDMTEFGPAREWFWLVSDLMLRLFNSTNLYGMAPTMIREELLFGTGCMTHDDDPLMLARFFTHTIGSYVIAQDHNLRVNRFGRRFEMTVDQIVRKFTENKLDGPGKNISQSVRERYDKSDIDVWFPVAQIIEPNDDFSPDSPISSRKQHRSVYWEPGQPDKDVVLSRKGYNEFPVYAPRWETTGEDIYGTNCPGMQALGDTRQLQLEEKTKAQGIEKMAKPPLHGPPSLANVPINNLPGFATIYDMQGDTRGLRPIYEVRLPVDQVSADIQNVEARIQEIFFVDLFKAISSMQGIQPRNQLEIFQRNQERLQELGPVLERQFGDFLEPMIERTFNQMARAGLLPPPPPELEGRRIRPRFVSLLALAQQAQITGNIDRFLAAVSNIIGAGFEGARDKVDDDEAVNIYAELFGVPPQIVREDREVERIRQARQQAAQQQRITEQSQAAAEVGEKAGNVKLDEDNVASRVIDAVNQRNQ